MIIYKIVNSEIDNYIVWEDNGILYSIPIEPANRHYQEYLEWLAEGNEPEIIEIN
jgi:hypothetical protein